MRWRFTLWWCYGSVAVAFRYGFDHHTRGSHDPIAEACVATTAASCCPAAGGAAVRVTHWINLTNGLQAIRDYGLTDWRALRLQSTWCEQKRWEDVLAAVPDEMLLRLALGEECRVYDYGARKPASRACWQGLEWVRYALTRRWTGEVLQPAGRASSMGPYLDEQYRQLGERTRRRLDYHAALAGGQPGRPVIIAVSGPTDRDGDREWLAGCLREEVVA